MLINGIPTKYINMRRSLLQGDPLSPFLFLMVAEGLSGMVTKAVDVGFYVELKVGNLIFFILQFADDTILLGKAPYGTISRASYLFLGSRLKN